MEVIYKKTHVIINDKNEFTSIKKRNGNGEYTMFTTVNKLSMLADKIEALGKGIEVLHIDYDNGFVKIKSSNEYSLNSIVDIVCQTLHFNDEDKIELS